MKTNLKESTRAMITLDTYPEGDTDRAMARCLADMMHLCRELYPPLDWKVVLGKAELLFNEDKICLTTQT